ncbi:MAG TPA: hypothetical protein VHX44_17570 [Planctomycetota bacterium]|nr:hypothetical protein [Planctomycetota bacterium]
MRNLTEPAFGIMKIAAVLTLSILTAYAGAYLYFRGRYSADYGRPIGVATDFNGRNSVEYYAYWAFLPVLQLDKALTGRRFVLSNTDGGSYRTLYDLTEFTR